MDTSPSYGTRLSTLIDKHLFLPSFFPRLLHPSTSSSSSSSSSSTTLNRWRNIIINPSNPIRSQGCLIVLYVLTTVIFCSVGYETFDENLYWRDDRLVSLGGRRRREDGLGSWWVRADSVGLKLGLVLRVE